MDTTTIVEHLQRLIGLNVSIVRRSAAMLVLHFGAIRSVDGGTVGVYALHVQCPWRIEGPTGIIAGQFDLWEPVDEDVHLADDGHLGADEDRNTLQDLKLRELLSLNSVTGHVERTQLLVVEAVAVNSLGDVTLDFTEKCRLVLFPAASRGEHWRLLQPDTSHPHLVIEDDRVSLD